MKKNIRRQLSIDRTSPSGNMQIDSISSLLTPLLHRFIPTFLSQIPAGWPSPADDYVDNQLDLNDHLILNKDETFILSVSGHSMKEAGIFDGDEIIVDRTIDPADGHIVVAVINGELTVKRLMKKGHYIRLLPANPVYPEITLHSDDELVVFGVVTYVLHKVREPWS